ncbi:MAG TPA: hypothetical protein VGJ20_24685, partial [Xanthobacteraceae bacterium]
RATPAFYEGVRARPIDKDQSPHGEPATLAAVDDAAVGLYFSPLSAGETALRRRSRARTGVARVGWAERRGWARIALHRQCAWFETCFGFAETLLTMT